MEKVRTELAAVRPPKEAGVKASALRAARATRAGRTSRRRSIIMVEEFVRVMEAYLHSFGELVKARRADELLDEHVDFVAPR